MLVLDRLSHRYPGAAARSLDGVSLQVGRGQVLGLLGPNGAGKSTLMAHLAGLIAVQEGQIRIDGHALAAVRAREPTRIGVAPQDHAFYPMLTVAENLACFAAAARLRGPRCASRLAACQTFAQLHDFAAVRAERLSGGLKRRLNLAIALLAEPELILFDEPTVGVDPQTRAFVLDAIRRLADAGAAVIYASHYMEEVEAIADHVVILDHGRVLRDGALSTLLSEGGRLLWLCAPDADAALLSPFGSVSCEGEQWCVRLDASVQPAQVLAALAQVGVNPRQIEFGRGSLERLFMMLTHRSLRDGP